MQLYLAFPDDVEDDTDAISMAGILAVLDDLKVGEQVVATGNARYGTVCYNCIVSAKNRRMDQW